MRYFICYDIPDNKLRRNVAKFLESFATRQQYSVFTCYCSSKKIEQIRKKLVSLVGKADLNRLVIIPVCQACESRLWQFGEAYEAAPQYVIA